MARRRALRECGIEVKVYSLSRFCESAAAMDTVTTEGSSKISSPKAAKCPSHYLYRNLAHCRNIQGMVKGKRCDFPWTRPHPISSGGRLLVGTRSHPCGYFPKCQELRVRGQWPSNHHGPEELLSPARGEVYRSSWPLLPG